MYRRQFLYATAGLAAAAIWPPRRALAEGHVERFTETVETLTQLTPERRRWLAENPDGLTPIALNAQLPEITQLEMNNTLARAEAPEQLRVIAWNIERGRRWDLAAKLIAEHPGLRSPDVLLISEMDIGMARSGNEHTTRRLAEALRMNYVYGVEFLELARGDGDTYGNWERDNTWGIHGNAVLARFPLHNVRMLRFPGIATWYGSGEHRLGGRNAICAEIDWQGQRTLLVSTHFESGLLDRPARTAQAAAIVAEVEQYATGMPVLFGGDLNDIPKSPPLEVLRRAGFEVDACNRLEQSTSVYAHEGRIAFRGLHIDYLAVRGARCVATEHTPAVVLAAYPPVATGELIGDHAAIAMDVVRGE